jgi:hypothetical protein
VDSICSRYLPLPKCGGVGVRVGGHNGFHETCKEIASENRSRKPPEESFWRFRDSIFEHTAAHGVTQKPTLLINQRFRTKNCKFFFHESAR